MQNLDRGSSHPVLIALTSAARSSTGIMGSSPGVFDWQVADIVHDGLPFLDLPEIALLRYGGDAALIQGTLGRKQIGRVMARIVERLDLRFEWLAFFVFGDQKQLALCVAWDGDKNFCRHRGSR
jgi:hypothetical protein